MEPIIDHIEITVRDMSVAVEFYDKLLPLLGFALGNRSSALIAQHEKHVVSYEHPRLGFAITSPRRAFMGETIHRRTTWVEAPPGVQGRLSVRSRSPAF